MSFLTWTHVRTPPTGRQYDTVHNIQTLAICYSLSLPSKVATIVARATSRKL